MANNAHKTYQMLTKSAIPSLFQKHRLSLKPQSYIAAAHVFPMRVNNHIVDDLIDWYASWISPSRVWPLADRTGFLGAMCPMTQCFS